VWRLSIGHLPQKPVKRGRWGRREEKSGVSGKRARGVETGKGTQSRKNAKQADLPKWSRIKETVTEKKNPRGGLTGEKERVGLGAIYL